MVELVDQLEVETGIEKMKLREDFHNICVKYDELLGVLGEVSDDDIIALVLLAQELSEKEDTENAGESGEEG